MTEAPFDAIVIGTGFGGSVAACRLAQAGKTVCILERGRRYPLGDFPRPAKRPDNLPHIARFAWAIDHGLWDVRDLQGVLAAQAAGYGGGSLVYANVHLRPPPEIFLPAPTSPPTNEPENAPKPEPEGWPAVYSRRELDPYYDIVAAALRVRPLPATLGAPSSVTRLPKVDALRQVATNLGRARWFFMPPLAIDFDKCIMCAECVAGCQFHAKNTLDLNYLAEAEKSPKVDVRTLAEVDTIELGADGTYTVTYLDHITGGTSSTVSGNSVFLCAGAVNSTHLLLRSKGSLGIDPHSQDQIGRRFFGNGDAIAMTFDTTKGVAPTPTVGPTIATTLLYNGGSTANLRAAPDAWFVLQDGGYPKWLAPVLGVFRAEFWLERNRITKGPGSPTPFNVEAATRVTEQANAIRQALLGLLDARLAMRSSPLQIRAMTAAALGLIDVIPKQLRDLGKNLQNLVHRLEVDNAGPVSRLALDDVGDHVKEKHPLFKWAVEKGKEWADEFLVGSTLEAVHRYFLNAPKNTAQPFIPAILWPLVVGWVERLFLDRKPDDNALLMLAVGVDAAPGKLFLDDDERLLAYWDLAGNVPFSSTQERLMQDVAGALGGELRLNPDWTSRQRPVTVHCLGGCAMADAPANGVTDPNGKVWGTHGVYVLDGAAIPSSLGMNPSATIAAVAERNVRKALADPASPVSTPTPLPMDEGVPGWPPGMKLADIRRQLGQTDEILDPARNLPQSPLPLARAVGLTFQEVMQGFYKSDPFVNLPIRSDLRATIADLNLFLVDLHRRVDIKGNVTLRLEPDAAPVVYTATGTLALLKRAETVGAVEKLFSEWLDASRTRGVSRQTAVNMDWLLQRLERQAFRFEMVYDLTLDAPGDQLGFNGVKRIGWRRGLSVWQETTTLDVTLSRPGQPGFGKGIMHVHIADFLATQLPSFTITNTDDSVRIAWAFGRFFRFFFGTLRQVYLPNLETLNPFGDRAS